MLFEFKMIWNLINKSLYSNAMKTELIRLAIAAAVLAMTIPSCNKDINEAVDPIIEKEETEATVKVTPVVKDDPGYEVSSALFLVYDDEGAKVCETEQASLETVSMKLKIGEVYSFYVLLNAESLTTDDYATEDKMQAFMDRMIIGAYGSYLKYKIAKTGNTVNVVCTAMKDNFRFSDQSTAKAFDFLEYERIFQLTVVNGNNSVSVDIPDECKDWIKTVIQDYEYNGGHETLLYILLRENEGDTERSAHIVIRRLRSKTDLTLDVTQLGNRMDGSLRKAMTAFYDALDGDNWKNKENWRSDKPLIEWYGLSTAIRQDKDMFGETGSAYFGTEDKWSISSWWNNLKGKIPEEFWKACKYFEEIRIGNASLSGSVMPEYVWHKGLKSLNLECSGIKVPFNDAIKNAEDIEFICLDFCPLNCPLPGVLTQMTTLRTLSLGECGLTGELPSDIGNMISLRSFDIGGCPDLCGTLPDSFYDLKNIEYFNIDKTQIGGTIKEKIKDLHNLRSFNIAGCEFEGTIPEVMGEMDNLDQWDFAMNYFTALPQFKRYRGRNYRDNGTWSNQGIWVVDTFPLDNTDAYQRKKATGRPADLIYYYVHSTPSVDFPDQHMINYKYCDTLPMPIWVNVKYGIKTWTLCRIGKEKNPVWPYADDLQYPATEYHYDGSNWVHPKLEYPAREYYYDEDKKEWIHDASCPWDKEFIPKEGD